MFLATEGFMDALRQKEKKSRWFLMWKQVGPFEKELQNRDKNRNQRQPSFPYSTKLLLERFYEGSESRKRVGSYIWSDI